MTKVDIISGFLGAGKTTFIKELISKVFKDEKIVLIENEFGEIGIDSRFMQNAGIEVTEMNSGCICCTLVGDFAKSLKQVVETYAPDRIIIEPSGVGKLSEVVTAVEDVKAEAGIEINSKITVVDGKKAKMYMKNFGEFFVNQVEHASTIVISRTQMMKEEDLTKCLEILSAHNESATIITTPWDQLEGNAIKSAIDHDRDLAAEMMHEHHHHHDHDEHCDCGCHDHDHHEHHHHDHDEHCDCGCHDHDHHHHHADEVFASWGVETFMQYSEADITAMLNAFIDNEDFGMVLRAKGYVPAAEGEGWIYFDYTPGELNVRRGGADVIGRICVIGSKLQEEKLKELFRIG